VRLDEVQHELCCDHGIDRAAAELEHAQSRVDSQRVRRGHHVFLCMNQRFRRPPARRLGL
jgi:hypothetical protein